MVAMTTLPPIPADLAERLLKRAEGMGMNLPTYLVFLEQCQLGRLDAKAQDAVRHALTKHDASLRKLSQ